MMGNFCNRPSHPNNPDLCCCYAVYSKYSSSDSETDPIESLAIMATVCLILTSHLLIDSCKEELICHHYCIIYIALPYITQLTNTLL